MKSITKVRTGLEAPGVYVGETSIKNTKLRRFLVLAAVKLFRHQRGRILFATPTLCIKIGEYFPEASTMQYIARNTSIPVPKVHCAFAYKDSTYIVMSRVKGKALVHGWLQRSPESQAAILKQLRGMVENMRRLKPPSAAVANVDRGALSDCRLPGACRLAGSDSTTFGPFDNILAFHSYLRSRGGLGPEFAVEDERLSADINELIRFHNRKWPDPVFTHGDLSSLNIMADGDVVTGIIDRETAGWYPYYWEYSTACQVNYSNRFWRAEIDHFLEPFPDELNYEEIRRWHFGDTQIVQTLNAAWTHATSHALQHALEMFWSTSGWRAAGVVASSGNENYKTLRNNVNASWTRDPGLRRLNIGIATMFASAAAKGYDGSLINGLLAIPYFNANIVDVSSSLLGLTLAGISLGGLPSFIPASYVSDYMGRRFTVAIGSSIMLAAAIIQCATSGVYAFLGTRIMLSIGLGFSQTASPVLLIIRFGRF
ncbi:hypothetical protein LTR97_000009 [Elasticomyces elasticus]|uniref:Major facilitator superfamily (MFS) profile domain-containing protein n=1 Tax=Elasticomyces elasticus TaxID=574655 RepID=A0AAN7WJM5_9PEZI|nr:hypothetical protein LTR97_000009 [Elasticomyces elasticus]